MVVRYFTDLVSEDSLANHFEADGSIARAEGGWPVRCRTDVSITVYGEPSPEVVERVIASNAPVLFLETKEEALTGNVAVLPVPPVGSVADVKKPPTPPSPARVLSPAEVAALAVEAS